MSGYLLLAALGLVTQAFAGDLKGTVRIDGSSTVYPITEAVAEEFQLQNPKVKITVGVSGTGGGFKKFATGEIDINNASRPISTDEATKAKDQKIYFIELPIAYDGLTVVINPRNTFVKTLTMAQLKQLWEPGSRVKTWRDLNPSWPSETIKLYGHGADSGTFDYFTEHVVGKAKASRTDYTASEDDNALVKGVAGDINALGYFGYAYFIENKNKVTAISIDGGKGAIPPNDQTIESSVYPLSRLLFICVNQTATVQPQVDAFVNFYLKNVGKLAKTVGYTPLAETLYTTISKRYETRATGPWQSH